jgi:hypothetical protein
MSMLPCGPHLPRLLAQVYGKGMAEKILALAADFEKLEADATARKAQLQPLVDAERQRQQEAAAAAQREEEEQQRRCSPKTVWLESSWTGLCHADLDFQIPWRLPVVSRRLVVIHCLTRCPNRNLQGCRGCSGKGTGGRAEAPGSGGCSAGGSPPKRGQVWCIPLVPGPKRVTPNESLDA